MALAIRSALGSEYKSDLFDIAEAFEAQHPQTGILLTPQEEPAIVDGILFNRHRKEMSGLFEAKARKTTTRDMVEAPYVPYAGMWGNEWILDVHKVDGGMKLAAAFGVPFIGMCLLDGSWFWVKLGDKSGNPAAKRRVLGIETVVSNIDDTLETRDRYLIDLSTAKWFDYPSL